tara:strand:- start:3588 stop:3704 length:117 start_codon:yes stop_codon:yes gene_type:complete
MAKAKKAVKAVKKVVEKTAKKTTPIVTVVRGAYTKRGK